MSEINRCRCPYTEQCKTKAQTDFAPFPELIAIFDKDACSTRKPSEQERCARHVGLIADDKQDPHH